MNYRYRNMVYQVRNKVYEVRNKITGAGIVTVRSKLELWFLELDFFIKTYKFTTMWGFSFCTLTLIFLILCKFVLVLLFGFDFLCFGFLSPPSVFSDGYEFIDVSPVSDADVSSETSDKPQRIWVENFQAIDDPDTDMRPGYIKFQGYTKIPQILEVQIGDEVHLQCPDLADSPELRLLEAQANLRDCTDQCEALRSQVKKLQEQTEELMEEGDRGWYWSYAFMLLAVAIVIIKELGGPGLGL